LAGFLGRQECIVLGPATANQRAYREEARRTLPRLLAVYLSTSREECEARDPKKPYEERKIAFVYEPPLAPEVTLADGSDPDGFADWGVCILTA
jgi:adenylylsulfate kinase-like enzyme